MFVIPIFFVAFNWNTAGYEAVTTDLPLSVKIRENPKYLVYGLSTPYLILISNSVCPAQKRFCVIV